MNETLFFIHIPKTAGTSLRHALEEEFPNSILKDYGNNPETSQILYGINNNGFEFEVYLETNSIKVFTGHTRLKNNRFHFRSQNIFCFIRNPVDQVLSHYNHHTYHNNYTNSLETFVADKRFQNVQSKYLAGLPIQQIGFIGITEQYAQSLAMINAAYNLNLIQLKHNKSISHKPTLTQEALDLIKLNNASDLELYESALHIFEERKALFMKSIPWTYGSAVIEKMHLRGWAYNTESTEAVSISVYINDVIVTDLVANQLLLNMRAFGAPRNGYVGYAFKLSKESLDGGGTLKIVNSVTKQVISIHNLRQ